MVLLPSNLKFLRKRRKLSQADVAIGLDIKRTSLSGYENGSSEPPLQILLKLAEFYHIREDHLLRTDLSKIREEQLSQLERGVDVDIKGNRLRVLATTINEADIENIEAVPVKAKAGYTAGYADPEFIGKLQRYSLPFIDMHQKYRSFQIEGDSMPPLAPGDWVTCAYLEDWSAIKEGQYAVVVTADEGIVFKQVFPQLEGSKKHLLLCSTNPAYAPYRVAIEDVLEVWAFRGFFSRDIEKSSGENISGLTQAVRQLQKEVAKLSK